MSVIVEALERLGACGEALRWAQQLPPDTTPEAAYHACLRPDWLVWLATDIGVDHIVCRRAALPMVRAVLPVWDAAHPNDRRPHDAVALVERVLRGETVPDAEVEAAYDAVHEAISTTDDERAYHAVVAAGWLAEFTFLAGGCSAAHRAERADPAVVAATLPEVRAILPWSLVRDAIATSDKLRALGIAAP